ncbi:5709_t:CDS:2, partial [Acaulospora colombiana]
MRIIDKIFYKALTKFKSLRVFANAINDKSVPYWTAAITEVDPFERINDLIIYPNKQCQDIIDSITLSKSVDGSSSKTDGSSTEHLETSASYQATSRTSFSKRLPRYMLLSVAIPILVPVGGLLILGTVATQGMISRKRVKAIKETNGEKLDLSADEDGNGIVSGITKEFSNLEEEVIEGVINLTNRVDSQLNKSSSLSQNDSYSKD